jgi:hypothetical protein
MLSTRDTVGFSSEHGAGSQHGVARGLGLLGPNRRTYGCRTPARSTFPSPQTPDPRKPPFLPGEKLFVSLYGSSQGGGGRGSWEAGEKLENLCNVLGITGCRAVLGTTGRSLCS